MNELFCSEFHEYQVLLNTTSLSSLISDLSVGHHLKSSHQWRSTFHLFVASEILRKHTRKPQRQAMEMNWIVEKLYDNL